MMNASQGGGDTCQPKSMVGARSGQVGFNFRIGHEVSVATGSWDVTRVL